MEVVPLRSRIRRIVPYFGQLRQTWFILLIAATVAAATEPLIPALLKPLLDEGFQKGALEVWMVPAALMLLFATRGLAGYVAQIALTRITHHGLSKFRREMFERLLNGHMGLFASNTSSSLANTIVYEAQNGATLLVNSVLSLVRNGLTLLALTGYLFYLNWQLTLIVAAVFPSVVAVMRFLTKRLHQLTKTTQNATDDLAYVVEENVLAHRDVRLSSAQSQQLERFAELNTSLRRLAMKSTVAGAAMTPLTQLLAAVALSAVISVALIQSSGNGTTVGDFAAFVTAMLMIIAPIRQLSEVSSPITRGIAALERGLDLITSVASEADGTFSSQRCRGEIRLSDVSVRYPGAEGFAIESVNLRIEAGEIIALVGASGSGKSTLVNLLPRFIDWDRGAVFIDNVDIRQWKLQSLRAQFSIVSQHVVMLNASIAENIALGLPIDRAKVAEVLASSDLERLIQELPEGIDTVVGHNAMQLSGGQRQRLAIARALYKDSPILILDEATSALDNESEKAIQESLSRLMKGRTTIVIAHRLSTVRHANRIIVMNAGKIAESGTHEQLTESNGLYARLHQFGMELSN